MYISSSFSNPFDFQNPFDGLFLLCSVSIDIIWGFINYSGISTFVDLNQERVNCKPESFFYTIVSSLKGELPYYYLISVKSQNVSPFHKEGVISFEDSNFQIHVFRSIYYFHLYFFVYCS